VYNKTAYQLALEIGSLLNVEISRCQFNDNDKDSETKIELLESIRNKDVYLIIQFEMNNNSD
jgi:phosphoribosylpyrophosphate synthetase